MNDDPSGFQTICPDPQPQQVATLRDHLRIRRNAVGILLMLAGVLTLITFHFIPVDDHYGWALWIFLFQGIRNGSMIEEASDLFRFSSLINVSLISVASPLLFVWTLRNSRIKWSLALFAGMAAGTMWYLAAVDRFVFVFILALAPTFTLAGLLCIKSVPSPTPANRS